MRIDRIKLIAEMARQDVNVTELSKRSNVSRCSISAMRSGKTCSKNTAAHIARALGVEVTELLPDNED